MKFVVILILSIVTLSLEEYVVLSRHIGLNCFPGNELYTFVFGDRKCYPDPTGAAYARAWCQGSMNTIFSQTCGQDKTCVQCNPPQSTRSGCVNINGTNSFNAGCGRLPMLAPQDFIISQHHVSDTSCSTRDALDAVVRGRCYSFTGNRTASTRIFCDNSSGQVRLQWFNVANCAGNPNTTTSRTTGVCYGANEIIPSPHTFLQCVRSSAKVSELNIATVPQGYKIFPTNADFEEMRKAN